MMTLDDVRIPDDIDAAIRQVSAVAPPQAWDLDALRSRARHRLWWRGRRGRRRFIGLVGGAVAAIVAGSAALIAGPALGPALGPDGRAPSELEWVLAGDPDHLYATRPDCPASCSTTTLLGSDDGGVTWSRRTTPARSFRPSVGPGGAIYTEFQLDASPTEWGSAVSRDGGWTWKSIVDDPAPWPDLPTDAKLICSATASGCALWAIDPLTGRSSPLPQQPEDSDFTRFATVGAVIWLDGGGGARRTTVSRDGGHTWRTESQPCPGACDESLVVGTDGTTVYRVRLVDGDGDVIASSTDSGATWTSFGLSGAPTPAGADPSGQLAGIVTPGGTLVVLRFAADGGVPQAWTLGPQDTQAYPAQLVGLPVELAPTLASGLGGAPDIGYLIKPTQGETVYRSLDGLTWRAVPVPRQ
jgi:hypothetical protein